MPSELELEIRFVGDFFPSEKAGLSVLFPRNVGRPLARFGAVPSRLGDVPQFVVNFVQSRADKKATNAALWRTYAGFNDLSLIIRRKVWEAKLMAGRIEHDQARMLCVHWVLSRNTRSSLHEGFHHCVKHNEDIDFLTDEIKDHLETVVQNSFVTSQEALLAAATTHAQNILAEKKLKLIPGDKK